MAQDEFCAICEKKLGKKDSEHVCRKCFRQAREPKQVEVKMSDRAAQTLGLGIAVGSFLTWGLGKLMEDVKVVPMTKEEARRKLGTISLRLKKAAAADPKKEDPKRARRPGRGIGEK